MTVEQLIELRNNAITKKNKTGYPHLDRSDLQFHTEEQLRNSEIPNLSMYGLLQERIIDNKFQDLIAMDYFGRKITYGEFLEKINEYASAFINLGIKSGEVVSISSPNIPEVFYSIYALNKIGAVANLIDPRNNLDRIKQYINQAKSTKLIMLDIVYPKLALIIEDTKLEKVYTISASDSLPLGLNYLQTAKTIVENHRKGLPRCPKNDVYQPLTKLVSEKKDARKMDMGPNEITFPNEPVKNDVAIIINTSGTTGSPKGVMLTNENFNAIANSYINTSANFTPGDTFLGIMPNFLAYGIGLGTHVFFVLGAKNVLIPQFKPEDFPKLILKHRPAHFAGVPSYFQYLLDDKKVQKADLSFIKNPCAGGDSMDPNFKKKCNEFLKAHNCPFPIMVGYGLTEVGGMATGQFYMGESTEENELYTAGVPTLYNTIYIKSLETGEYLKTNQEGEIILSGESIMKGYINNQEETDEVIEVKDGVRYLHTGDVGYVDEEGLLYHTDRIKRIIIRPDGHNVFPSYIEKVVSSHPSIRECVCVGLKSGESVNGRLPIAFITLEEGHEAEVEQIIEELKELSLRELPERDVALDYIVLDKIPITENGKINIIELSSYPYEKGKRRIRV